jgi:hypothetical protein
MVTQGTCNYGCVPRGWKIRQTLYFLPVIPLCSGSWPFPVNYVAMLERNLILFTLFLVGGTLMAQQPPQFDPNANLKTGPEIGQKIPEFSAVDQTGKVRNFDSLKGPKGLVLFFNRSVDW